VPGANDFDFLVGRWTVFNRRLQRPLERDDADWREFTMEVENRPLAGLGNVDVYRSSEFPGIPTFEAMALRLFDPEQSLWRIWWASTSSAGQLDTPVVGEFAGGHGVFLSDDVLGGRPVRVRYEWLTSDRQPEWRQSFSFDEGLTWQENWIMNWRRRDA
jgi:hypothetical protein